MSGPPTNTVLTDLDEPVVFRTTSSDVGKATLKSGSLWLRSDQYYREMEDRARRDESEGSTNAKLGVPLRVQRGNGPSFTISGSGYIGQTIAPHYILSLHGPSISPDVLHSFGTCTFGVKSISRLSAEILYRCSLIIKCTGYRFGQVLYQRGALAFSLHNYGAPLKIADDPPIYVNLLNTNVLIKEPVHPFIEQDEWRVAIFVQSYLDGDPHAPMKINVDPEHFYHYRET